MKIDGSCHCGAITYEAELDPKSVGVCHCTDCQALSATAFRTIGVVRPGEFRLLSGTPKIYVKTGDSGNKREQAFCENCGSGIYASSTDDEPRIHNIRMGTVRQRAEFPPMFQVWCQSALSWLPEIDTPKKLDQQ
ncbi:MAG: GFA family protein [bacterium]